RWDEEGRLRAVDLKPENSANRPEIANYTYDADGQRTVRYVPGHVDAVYSGRNAGDKARVESFIYPSELLTVKTLSLKDVDNVIDLEEAPLTTYTKHYYVGAERIASVLGTTSHLGMLCPLLFSSEGINPNAPLISNAIQAMDGKTQTAAESIEGDYQAFGKTPNLEEPFLYEGKMPRCGQMTHDASLYRPFYFHPDHLGSSSYISNMSGRISQHMEYLPFGETLIEEHKNSNNSPYKFNGKELDDETGNYYYGARY